MKIIKYKQDGITPVLKTVRNCKILCTVCGKDFYCAPVEKDERLTDYYYHIGGTIDLLGKLDVSVWDKPEDVIDLLSRNSDMLSSHAPNKAQIIERLKAAVENHTWTSNGDAFFCELVGEIELAEAIRHNRAKYLERQHKAELEKAELEERERIAEEEALKQERLALISDAKALVLSEEFITAKQFELLAEDCGIALPVKLIGWLRQSCKGVRIQNQPEPPKGMKWEYKYRISYRTIKKHKSTSVLKYAERIAEFLGL